MKKALSVIIIVGVIIAVIIGCGGEGTDFSTQAPTLPSPESGTTIGDPTPLLNWEDIVGAIKYEIQVCEQPDFENNIIEAEIIFTETEFSDTPTAKKNS